MKYLFGRMDTFDLILSNDIYYFYSCQSSLSRFKIFKSCADSYSSQFNPKV